MPAIFLPSGAHIETCNGALPPRIGWSGAIFDADAFPDVDSLGTYAPARPRRVIHSEDAVIPPAEDLPRRKPVVPAFESFE